MRSTAYDSAVPEWARQSIARTAREHPENLPGQLSHVAEIEAAKRYTAEHPAPPPPPPDNPRDFLHLVRVSGATGQESSLDAQEAELRATATGTVARVFRDRASGLREDRPGLEKMLSAVADRQVTVVRVTHEDRLARFGAGWLRRLLAVHGATVEVLHAKAQGGREELLEDFISLVTTFAGRLYGMRSAAARKRLLAESGRCSPGGGR